MTRFSILVFVVGLVYVRSQYIPIGVGTTKKQPSCTYQFSVPDTKGACSATSSALDKKIDDVKADLDRTRLQYVSQNGVVQGTLNQLQSDTKTYVSQVNDLNVELQKIKQKLQSGTPTTGNTGNTGNNQNMNQLIHDTKDLLSRAVGDINGRIFNLTLEFQKNAVEESKVNSAIQSQINNQAVQLAKAEQKLLNLENLIKNYKPPTANVQPQPSTGPSNAQITQLQQKFKQLENDLQTVDSLQQTQFRGLSDKTNKIMSKLMNQSLDIDAVAKAANQSVSQLAAAEQLIKDTKKDFDKFKQATDPQLKILSQEASGLLSNISGIQTSIQQLGTQIMQGKILSVTQKADIARVKTQADNLAKDLAKLQTSITAQSGEILTLKSDLAGLKSPANIGSGGTINPQQLINTIKNQTQADIQQAQKDVKQVQNMVTTLLTQVATLSSKVTKLSG